MVGEFKDDALQQHKHQYQTRIADSYFITQVAGGAIQSDKGVYDTTGVIGRHADVTRGKRKGVKYIIKVL